MTEKNKNLEKWRQVVAKDEADYAEKLERMRQRERMYRGIRDVTDLGEGGEDTPHLYNIIYETVEAQVDASIYPIKVTSGHPDGEDKALKIEHMINDVLLRLPTDELIDEAERTVPIQGGAFWHIEWDDTRQSHERHGGIAITLRHPEEVIPQAHADDMDEMDHVTLRLAVTRDYIKRTFDIEVEDGEDAPEARSVIGESDASEDFVTMRVILYRGADGGLGKFVYVGNTVLCDMDDYDARKIYRCRRCGAPMPPPLEENTQNAGILSRLFGKSKKTICTACGGTEFELHTEEDAPILRDVLDESGNIVIAAGERVPYYHPRSFPLVLQKSVSLPHELLGVSDVDMIEDQQRSINLMEGEILRRLQNFGAVLSLPDDAATDDGGGIREIRLENPADADKIKLMDFELPTAQHTAELERIYREARNIIGITDSFQGRYDSSAKSGVAKQNSAAQAAGRLQSKKTMKAAAWARIGEIIFKYVLAYADDRMTVSFTDESGARQYEVFDRYDFLIPDGQGGYTWDDDYRFTVDSTVATFADRESLWAQVSADYQAGAYGQQGTKEALTMLWRMREQLHYPYAGQILRQMQADFAAAEEAAAAQLTAQRPDAGIGINIEQEGGE